MKINSFDTISQSLLVSFATDQSKQPVENYPQVAFQPYNFPSTDPNDVLKFLSMAGLGIARNQDQKESFEDNVEVTSNIVALVGMTFEVPIADIESETAPVLPNTQVSNSNIVFPSGPITDIPPEVVEWLKSQFNPTSPTGP